MAYWFAAGHDPGASKQVQFLMDTDSDKSSLPTSSSSGEKQGTDNTSCLPVGKGSIAFSIATGKVFMLNSSDQWIQIGG